MELFYSADIDGNTVRLDEEEAQHCIKVLRHRKGDSISVIDGKGTLYSCRLVTDSPRSAEAEILYAVHDWNACPYHLEMAVCPTKNIDRYEWFVEKACETGVDSIVPICGEHSERKAVKPQRLERILLSATKQSLKARIPELREMVSAKEYAESLRNDTERLRLIAYCFEDNRYPRISITEALDRMPESCRDISVLIGPEGDFSPDEASLALSCGFIPVHLGPARFRTETAALNAVFAAYSHFLLQKTICV